MTGSPEGPADNEAGQAWRTCASGRLFYRALLAFKGSFFSFTATERKTSLARLRLRYAAVRQEGVFTGRFWLIRAFLQGSFGLAGLVLAASGDAAWRSLNSKPLA